MARPIKHVICTIDGCGRPHMAKGWCGYHYNTARNHGDPLYLDRRAGQTCDDPSCQRPAGRNGYCKPHYLKRRRELGTQVRRGACSIDGCGKPHEAKGYCEDHYYRWRRYGDPLHPISCRKGTGSVNSDGYRVVTRGKRPILEHRWIMEQHLGRDLLPGETVHHKNGNRLDNRLVKGHELVCPSTCCNLELWSTSHPSGQRARDKFMWAHEIIRLYGDSLVDP